jgi:hypothetical protein
MNLGRTATKAKLHLTEMEFEEAKSPIQLNVRLYFTKEVQIR